MSNYRQPAPEGKNPELWEIAQKRVSFKNHAVIYLIINAFLWGIWFFTGNQHRGFDMDIMNNFQYKYPWPIWTTMGWGIGLAFHFAGAYIFPRTNSVENEYQKLKNQQYK
ncbi:2TM domain-containing protein [Ferruginibacter sp.]